MEAVFGKILSIFILNSLRKMFEISQKQAKICRKTHKTGIEREKRVGILKCLSFMLSRMGRG